MSRNDGKFSSEKIDSISSQIAHLAEDLNEAGQLLLLKLAQFFTEQPEYHLRGGEPHSSHTRAGTTRKEPLPPRCIRDYLTPEAVGYANPINGGDFFLSPVGADTPPQANFSVHIRDKSMEPYIMDGARIFVQRDETLEDFDVGLFFYEGQVHCKQFCTDKLDNIYLLAANPEMADTNLRIKHKHRNTLICYGKVLLPEKLPQPRYR